MHASDRYRLLIGGQLTPGASSYAVINPATEQVVAESPRADEAQLEAAVSAAHVAAGTWGARSFADRAAYLRLLAGDLEAALPSLAQILTAEQGKPLSAAAYEIGGAVAALRATADMDLPLEILRDERGSRIIRHRTPLGVVALIVPWNFPILLMMLKAAPALLAGNTLVIKPAPTTPLTTLRFGALCAERLPPGVVNIITDQNDLAPRLARHPAVAKIAFTGSTATGVDVMRGAADTLKRLSLELGGNDAAIVLDDADIETAAEGVFQAAMLNSGQICLGAKRVYAHDDIYDGLCAALARRASAAVVDDGANPKAEIGPLQNRAQLEKVLAYLEDARRHGRILAGGARLRRPGYFVAPTIVCDIDDYARLVREEQFGPIIPILRYHDEDDMIARVNATEYGLGATIWTGRPERGVELAKRVEAGVVWINKFMDLPFDIAISAARKSGLGAALGQEGLAAFTQAKVINAAV